MDHVLEPTLIVVSGRGGSGKTTLAHRLAAEIGCPAICRDEIKEGMVHAYVGDFQPEVSDPLTVRTYPLFFQTLRLLLTGGVTVIAEAAFQHKLWAQGLEPLTELADLRVIRCATSDEVLAQRRHQRLESVPTRKAHADHTFTFADNGWDPIHLPVPTLDVDTTGDYQPGLAELARFASAKI